MEKKAINKKWIIGGIVYAVLFLAVILLSNWGVLTTWAKYIIRILRPVIIGLTLAYILNPIFVFFERKLFYRFNPPSVRRFVSLLCSYLVLFALVVCLLLMIFPQLINSTITLLKNYETVIASASDFINGIVEALNNALAGITNKEMTFQYVDENKLLLNVTDFFSTVSIGESGNLLDYVNSTELIYDAADILTSMFSIVADAVLGIFISLYLLSSKEKRASQLMRARQAIFSDAINNTISRTIKTLDKSFGSFIKGKTVDSLIIGLLLFIALYAFGVPFALLVSSFIAILNIIPFFGYLLALIPTGLIVFLTDPGKLIPFLIIAILIQQLDTNIICPKVLGTNTGVSSLCVIIAISTMGSLWGLTGILLAVPLFATVLALSDYALESHLQKKGLPSEIESYYPNDALVDPVKDSHLHSDKLLKRLEKNILFIYRKRDTKNVKKLSWLERTRLKIYSIARKLELIPEFSDETVVQFCADQDRTASYRLAKEAFCRDNTQIANDKQVEQSQNDNT